MGNDPKRPAPAGGSSSGPAGAGGAGGARTWGRGAADPVGGVLSKFDFIGKRNIAFIISGGSVIVLWMWVFAMGGLKYGIDFTGGIQHIFKFNRATTPELLAVAREAALAVDPSSHVQNIGEPDEGEVMIQVKGFELVEKASAEIDRTPPAGSAPPASAGLADLKSRLAEFELLDTAFYERLAQETGMPSREKLKRVVSDYVNDATAQRLNAELERRFGAPAGRISASGAPSAGVSSAGRIDLNNVPSPARLVDILQDLAIRRLSVSVVREIPKAKTPADMSPLFDAAGLDMKPFEGKFLLRTPDLEEIKTDLREFADRPDRLAEVLKEMYPNGCRESFMPVADRIISGKERRGLYASMDEAVALVGGGRISASGAPSAGVSDAGPQSGLVKELLTEHFYTSAFVRIKTDQVSSRIGAELRQKALLVISLSLLAMLIYIWIRFEFRFAIGAVVTLLHDALTVIPLMSVIGYEYDINLIAAILTIIGYSLNDTIVVYDRIRENIAGMRGAGLQPIINVSIVQTLSRTVVTGITSLLAVLALFFFGGPVLEGFSLALFIGVIVGTYSSIFVSSPVVYLWPTK